MPASPQGEPLRLRRLSPRARLLRVGFVDTDRALRLLADPVLAAWVDLCRGSEQVVQPQELLPTPVEEQVPEPPEPLLALAEALGDSADPDLALLSLLRLIQACQDRQDAAGQAAIDATGGAGGEATVPAYARTLRALLNLREGEGSAPKSVEGAEGAGSTTGTASGTASVGGQAHAEETAITHRRRLLAILGASQALGDFLIAHPECLEELSPARGWDAVGQPGPAQVLSDAVAAALRDACAEPGARRRLSGVSALRRAYYRRLLALAADDLDSADPKQHVSVVWQRLSDLADAALEAALLLAREVHKEQCQNVSLAVIALGKTGARELNYVSDVDVVHVVGPAPGRPEADEAQLVAQGTILAAELARVVCEPSDEPALWPLDTALRPEGKDGALVRTVASHTTYYERWADSWEFQALLKARTCAGDRALGAAYEQAIAPFVWNAAARENFVQDARDMRQRVEHDSERPGEDLRLKLGPGGLRDVEFTVQLLQLVHGRSDESLRHRSTLEALEALTAGGYVGRKDAAALADGYRELRLLEHRSQLYRLQRTHTLPSRDSELRRVGRGITHAPVDPAELKRAFTATRRRVRALHEEIYYRPLLGAVADLSTEEMRLTPQAARERLAATGYLDPDGALRHIQALTEGVSRAAAIQRQLLPVMIGWIGDGPDPDAGLLNFRSLSETVGRTHWYLGMLRDSPVAARRLARVLSGARWTTGLLRELPESIAWLDDDAELRARPPGAVTEEVDRVLRRRSLVGLSDANLEQAAADAMQAVMGVRQRELVRAALADSLDGVDVERTGRILTDATDAVLEGALCVATALAIAEREGADALAGGRGGKREWPGAAAEHAIIAMGRLGGGEISYASDADVLFVYRPLHGVDPDVAAREAEAVARHTMRLLGQSQPHPLEVDCDLRPEGRHGAISRSLDSYWDYYTSWASVWERHALVRARQAAGSLVLGEEFMSLADSLRWRPEGLSDAELREIRRLKARMETERLPRGVQPAHHLKLGPGGLSDVEWTVQVLQLAHGGQEPTLRTTSTTRAMAAATACGLLELDSAERLEEAWTLAGRIRSAIVLGTGRTTGARLDIMPANARDMKVVAALLGAPDVQALEDRYRRAARRARAIVEKVLLGGDAGQLNTTVPGTAAQPFAQGPSAQIPQVAPRSTEFKRQASTTAKYKVAEAKMPGVVPAPAAGAPARKSSAAGCPGAARNTPGRHVRGAGPYPWS
ncbi:bifunctional [glutamine synthetase] adenylyltransferase/[glutamine synthetase]-adenylyl-L-tyrosine phosphorylase [Actinomyces trachealis]|uniref:bifunctional [glutamine synthetase] adenylyltransferase/[glutamine synthetase]-adenylyl-L-tyrosine phosphorylase n=1 Tax=Actinomyces trachealis TaxID=2763540 RepID=UPI0018928B88|nr:bifunctional [glutamine synthetase] adenylyltransferase/[glutamine synthetase]-adenylyl-L-tyrosine phosphorylase [Actinomyces trachealis]